MIPLQLIRVPVVQTLQVLRLDYMVQTHYLCMAFSKRQLLFITIYQIFYFEKL